MGPPPPPFDSPDWVGGGDTAGVVVVDADIIHDRVLGRCSVRECWSAKLNGGARQVQD